MKNKLVQVINKRDVHTLYIWNGDGMDMLENNISIQVFTTETPTAIESDTVVIYPGDGNAIVNVRSNDVELLKAWVGEIFPHLSYVGHPTVDGELFDTWYVYTDKRGADVINLDAASDTTIAYPPT